MGSRHPKVSDAWTSKHRPTIGRPGLSIARSDIGPSMGTFGTPCGSRMSDRRKPLTGLAVLAGVLALGGLAWILHPGCAHLSPSRVQLAEQSQPLETRPDP